MANARTVRLICRQYERAFKFAERIYENRREVCHFYTKNVFTCGHSSTVRGEGTNSRIKGRGILKDELSKCSLVESIERVQNIAYRQDVDSMKEMEALVTKGRKWSNFVDDIWREHQKHSYQLTVCQEIKKSKSKVRKFKVSNPDKSQIHEVTITIDGSEPPSCTCGRFKSTLIPCGGIGVGVGRCNEALYMDNNLVSR
jgi:hypothetical protein